MKKRGSSMKLKYFSSILSVILAILFSIGGTYYFLKKDNNNETTKKAEKELEVKETVKRSLITESLIAYTRITDAGYKHIFVVGTNMKGERQITRGKHLNYNPTWTKDGDIYFTSTRNGNPDIYKILASSNYTKEVLLTTNNSYDENPAVSPDGKYVLFESNRCLSNNIRQREVFIMNSDGSGQENVSFDPNYFDGSPAWSPDGKAFLFNKGSIVKGANGKFHIYVQFMENLKKGIEAKQLTSGNFKCNCNGVWLDDSTIVFQSDLRDNDFDIYSIRLDGSGFKTLAATYYPDIKPSVSPDRLNIIYETKVDFKNILFNVFRSYSLKGYNESKAGDILFPEYLFCADPEWSPFIKVDSEMLTKILSSEDNKKEDGI